MFEHVHPTNPHRKGAALLPGAPRDSVKAVLEDIVLASSGEDIAAWGCMEGAPSAPALRAAHKIVAKHNLTRRVCQANFQHGVAPSSRALLREYKAGLRSLSSQGVDLLRVAIPRRHDDANPRKFMSRWRRKHGVKFGRIRFGEPLTMAQKRAKVDPVFGPPFSGLGVPNLGLERLPVGTIFRPLFWARAYSNL